MELANLKVKIGADSQDLTQGLNKASNEVRNFAATVQKGSNQASMALTNLGRVAQDAPFGFIGIQNNINPLIESFQRLRLETGSNKAAFQSLTSSLMGAGGLGLAVSLATGVLTVLAQKGFFDTADKAKKAKEQVDEFQKSVNSIYTEAAKEATQVQSLIAVIDSETASRKRKFDALNDLKKIQPEIFGQLKLEGDTVLGLNAAYQSYLDNLQTIIRVKMLQAKLEDTTKRIITANGGALTKSEQDIVNVFKKSNDARTNAAEGMNEYKNATKVKADQDKQYNILLADQAYILKQIKELQAGVKINPDKIAKPKSINQRDELESPVRIKNDRLGLTEGSGALEYMRQFREEMTKTINVLKQIPSSFKVPQVITGAVQAMDKYREKLAQIGSVITTSIGQPMQQAFETIFSGGQNALQAFGNMIKQIVVKLVAAAATALFLSTILGAIGIGGGIGGGQFSFKSLFSSLSGLPKFAKGGLVTGATLAMVGDNPSGKEAIIPFERMGEFIKGIGGGGGQQVYIAENVVRGQDLVTIFRRANNSYNKNF